MREISIAVAVLMLSAAPAMAGDDPMASYFGNTVVSQGTMGESVTHYKPDHTFDAKFSMMGMSQSSTGTWKIDEKGQLCRTYAEPPPGVPNPLCTPLDAHKVGDSWTMTFNGSTRTVTIKPGIQ
jgi:hypothetical protein